MKKYVKFEIVKKKVLNNYLLRGWQIILYNEHEKNYEIGLPMEKAYEQTRRLAKKFITSGLLKDLFAHTCKKYGKDFNDYNYVNIYSIKQYNKTSSATHYIDRNDELNRELNEIASLLPIDGKRLFAKPIKKE